MIPKPKAAEMSEGTDRLRRAMMLDDDKATYLAIQVSALANKTLMVHAAIWEYSPLFETSFIRFVSTFISSTVTSLPKISETCLKWRIERKKKIKYTNTDCRPVGSNLT
jgi:hypothetical protein